MREIKDKVIVYGFSKAGTVAYSQIADWYDFHENANGIVHSWERIKDAGIVRLICIEFDHNGDITEEAENTYDEATGVLLTTRNYAYREHLKTNEKYQKTLARFHELRAQRADPNA
jgi:hypothetical protein